MKLYNIPIMPRPEISVILPAYNEKENIEKAVKSTRSYLQSKFKSFEIIVVNDGGTDGTQEVTEKLAKSIKELKLINHPRNLGYGATLGDGFRRSTGKLVFYTDSDNQYDIREMDKLLPLIKKYDIVAGYRLNQAAPPTRIITSYVYNLIIRILLGLKIKDIDCSFKLYRQEAFDNIDLKSHTGLIDAEILIKAQKAGFTVHQVGVHHYPRVKGRTIYEIGPLVNPKVPLEIFKEIKRLWPELT